MKREPISEAKGRRRMKREGPTPLSEINPNVLDLKCRKEGKHISPNLDDKTQMVGGEAVAARQHR